MDNLRSCRFNGRGRLVDGRLRGYHPRASSVNTFTRTCFPTHGNTVDPHRRASGGDVVTRTRNRRCISGSETTALAQKPLPTTRCFTVCTDFAPWHSVAGQVRANEENAAVGKSKASAGRVGAGAGGGYTAAAASAVPVAVATSSELAKHLEPLLNSEGGAKSLEEVRPNPKADEKHSLSARGEHTQSQFGRWPRWDVQAPSHTSSPAASSDTARDPRGRVCSRVAPGCALGWLLSAL